VWAIRAAICSKELRAFLLGSVFGHGLRATTYRESLRDTEACLHSMQTFASARVERATLPRKPQWYNLPWHGKASAEKHSRQHLKGISKSARAFELRSHLEYHSKIQDLQQQEKQVGL
jgi:hypothetical protein